MNRKLRALAARGRWKYRRFRWKLRRRRLLLRRALASPRGITSLALFPFVILMAASAAFLHAEASRLDRTDAGHPSAATLAELALQPYVDVRDEIVGEYAARHRVPEPLARLIYEIAVQERVNPDLAFRLVRTESSFRLRAVSSAGAVGLAQVRPSTARWLDSTVTRERLFEAETNLRLGFRYLRMLLGMYGHDTRLALLAYNRGPGTVAALLSLGEDPGNGYAARVMGTPRRLARVTADPPAVDPPAVDPPAVDPGAPGGTPGGEGRPVGDASASASRSPAPGAERAAAGPATTPSEESARP